MTQWTKANDVFDFISVKLYLLATPSSRSASFDRG